MKLFTLILALSCVIAYTVAQNREQLNTNIKFGGSHQFRFGAHPFLLFSADIDGYLQALFGAKSNQALPPSSNVLEKRSS
ncbi:hypothetical protein ALC57_10962 [Trachymyrmex cornetzi]|uniref:Uncharacterized protein n=1 Tax=Trachymyrmex cornetzi TaxID=471704 RepID=A0A195DV27_9HYME|nr:hypothetical protein ALC57_10962 [Trachymyrmex cornetzi]